jgi:hypothetical protein
MSTLVSTKLGRLQTINNEYSFFEFQIINSNFRIRENLKLSTIRISNNFEFEYEYLRTRILTNEFLPKGFKNTVFLIKSCLIKITNGFLSVKLALKL